MDKSWMSLRHRWSEPFKQGVKKFLQFALANVGPDSGPETEIMCPCTRCGNLFSYPSHIVAVHLVCSGITQSYQIWVNHGESPPVNEPHIIDEPQGAPDNETNMEVDIGDDNEEVCSMLDDYYTAKMANECEGGTSSNFERENVLSFNQLLDDAQREVYSGCKNFNVLSFVIKMLNLKVMHKWSAESFNNLMEVVKSLIPESDEKVPWSLYEAKKFLRDLGLGYECIHACQYDCAIFWKENADLDKCPVCQESRYKLDDGKGRKIPHKVLRYFPLAPRLKRLFMSRKTAPDMRWHKEKLKDDGYMRHPADGDEWKNFDSYYTDFSKDSRNVRLGLASDGFNPFGSMSNSYSMWPVIVTPYNLPPWKCMKEPFSIMSLLIPVPTAPGRDIDVYLRPLIDELKELWGIGVPTYDASIGETFQMRACVMWTINDFPAYGNLSGWSTKGYLACPICNEDASSQRLVGKIGYTGARRFLHKNHGWRRSKLFNGKSELRERPMELSGEQILEQVDSANYKPFGKHPENMKRNRNHPNGLLNWKKKSIFFELPYWKTLQIRHNLDVMHIEKNICDNVLGTLLGIDRKNKDTEKARMDLENLNIRQDLHLRRLADGSAEKPRASYALPPDKRRCFNDFLRSIKYPDGYAANLSRSVKTSDGKITGLKSHDCHVLLQRILPIGMRGFVDKEISTALFELGNFFRELCSKTLKKSDLYLMEDRITIVLCKLEKIFPPAFFDVMVHLAIHLPREVILGGPVQFRWMYPIERFLGTLKGFVGNRARPEGSIAERYIDKECITFCSMYLSGVETFFNRSERNDDGGPRGPGFDVFTQAIRLWGKCNRNANESLKDLEAAHWFILNNNYEITRYREEHEQLLENEHVLDIAKKHREQFPKWFKARINQLRSQRSPEATDELWSLANGPLPIVHNYASCISDGQRFHTIDRDNRRKTQNSGLVVEGDHNGKLILFYGYLTQVWELEYILNRRVVLFKCEWFKTSSNRTIVTDDYCTTINVSGRWYKDDPFVLPSQVKQVYYVNDTKLGDSWKVVERVSRRGVYYMPEIDEDSSEGNENAPDEVYQEEVTSTTAPIVAEVSEHESPLHRYDLPAEVVPREVVEQATKQANDDSNDDDDDDDDVVTEECSDVEEDDPENEAELNLDTDIIY